MDGEPWDREQVYTELMDKKELTLDYLARLTDYQLLLHFRQGSSSEDYPDGGGGEDSAFWMFWMSGRTNGKTDAEIVARWHEMNPGRENEAVIGKDWEAGIRPETPKQWQRT